MAVTRFLTRGMAKTASSQVTDVTETNEDPDGTVEEDVIPARKWDWWLLPSMVSGFWANISRASACFFDEVAMACAAHSVWRNDRQVDTDVVDSFREQLKVL